MGCFSKTYACSWNLTTHPTLVFSAVHPLLSLPFYSSPASLLMGVFFVFNFLGTSVNFFFFKKLVSELKELMKFPKVPSLFKQSLHFNPEQVNLWSSPTKWQEAKPVSSLFNWFASTHWPPEFCLHSLSCNMHHSSLLLSKSCFSWDLIYGFLV